MSTTETVTTISETPVILCPRCDGMGFSHGVDALDVQCFLCEGRRGVPMTSHRIVGPDAVVLTAEQAATAREGRSPAPSRPGGARRKARRRDHQRMTLPIMICVA
jgi:hypothetical protein